MNGNIQHSNMWHSYIQTFSFLCRVHFKCLSCYHGRDSCSYCMTKRDASYCSQYIVCTLCAGGVWLMTAVISESSNRNVKSLPTLLTGSQCQRVAGFGGVVRVRLGCETSRYAPQFAHVLLLCTVFWARRATAKYAVQYYRASSPYRWSVVVFCSTLLHRWASAICQTVEMKEANII